MRYCGGGLGFLYPARMHEEVEDSGGFGDVDLGFSGSISEGISEGVFGRGCGRGYETGGVGCQSIKGPWMSW